MNINLINIKEQFIKLSLKYQALKYGDFTLKSGKSSGYFFNAGEFNDGYSLMMIGEYLAHLIKFYNIKFDILFGPAYKGIPLVTAAAMQLELIYNINSSVTFSRKEMKKHGEKGQLIGDVNLKDKKVLIIDDVLSYGTAFKESLNLITQHGGKITSLVTLLNREEIINDFESITAAEDLQKIYDIEIFSIIKKADLNI